jgi:hypothetical protein
MTLEIHIVKRERERERERLTKKSECMLRPSGWRNWEYRQRVHPWKANCIGSAHSHIDWQIQGEKIRTIRETETDVEYGDMTRPGGRPMYTGSCVCSR